MTSFLKDDDADKVDQENIAAAYAFAAIPARELLGEMLLEVNQPEQALREFEASQRVDPNRFRSLYGAAHAAELAGDQRKARIYYAKLVSLCQYADTERLELKHGKAFLRISLSPSAPEQGGATN